MPAPKPQPVLPLSVEMANVLLERGWREERHKALSHMSRNAPEQSAYETARISIAREPRGLAASEIGGECSNFKLQARYRRYLVVMQ
ncbi:MAG: hypothetical protein K0S28_1349 [Paucimonas sp.]|jgi:hypothetical protein|nr:hypothetical protein [Paucimonas sp.]